MFASLVAAMITIGLHPLEDVASDTVDLIEWNHYYNEHGKLVFQQLIFYDWSTADCHYHVRAWRLLKRPAQLPHRNWKLGDYVAIWHDRQGGNVLRKVRAKTIRHTWTQYDPEVDERVFLPQKRRRELGQLNYKRPKGR